MISMIFASPSMDISLNNISSDKETIQIAELIPGQYAALSISDIGKGIETEVKVYLPLIYHG